MYIITATYNGKKITRRAFSDFQAWTIINTLRREGATEGDQGVPEWSRVFRGIRPC